MNIQGWFPLGLTSLISLLSKGLSRVFSNTTVWKYQFFGAQPSLLSISHICTWLLEKTIALTILDFPGSSDGKVSAYNAGDPGSIPRLGRSSGEGNGNPLQYSCLENPMDGRVWLAIVHGVAKSRTWLSDVTFTFTLTIWAFVLILKAINAS